MGVKALDGNYNFYELLKDVPGIDAGAMFYWDKNDSVYGSILEGCVKLCWTQTGSSYSGKDNCGLAGDTIIFHASVREDKNWFKLTQICEYEEDEVIQEVTIEDIEAMIGHRIKIISREEVIL